MCFVKMFSAKVPIFFENTSKIPPKSDFKFDFLAFTKNKNDARGTPLHFLVNLFTRNLSTFPIFAV